MSIICPLSTEGFPIQEGFEDIPENVKKGYQVKRAHLKKFKI